jgi:hypothetical protein
MIRDGGSLAAVWQGVDGAEYWLFFKIKIERRNDGTSQRVAYSSPVIVDRLTGMHFDVSWEHALVLLHQMRLLVSEDGHMHWLETMECTARTCGQIPPGIDRTF